jgi:hypothetical protein
MKLYIIVDPFGPFPSDCQVYLTKEEAEEAIFEHTGYGSYAELVDTEAYGTGELSELRLYVDEIDDKEILRHLQVKEAVGS